jgi:hypothetical protein
VNNLNAHFQNPAWKNSEVAGDLMAGVWGSTLASVCVGLQISTIELPWLLGKNLLYFTFGLHNNIGSRSLLGFALVRLKALLNSSIIL